MSRSFVVGKRNSRVVFGRFCAEAFVNEVTTIVIEKKRKRQSIFIKQRERSEQSAVERIGCNSDFIPRLDAAKWRIGFGNKREARRRTEGVGFEPTFYIAPLSQRIYLLKWTLENI